jgi:2-succinyl-5-enolpyruvyl-6-hydroxy-3-cyclohexene-1-carboxylate synthase
VAQLAPAATLPVEVVEDVAQRLAGIERGAIVCGSTSADVAGPVTALAAQLGWPVLAEPTSGVRCGPHDHSHVVAHYDALLRAEGFATPHAPQLVLRIGDTPTSKALRGWLASAPQLVVDPHSAWHEPTRAAETLLAVDPALLCVALTDAIGRRSPSRDDEWLGAWRAADAAAAAALEGAKDPFEPRAYCAIEPELTDGSLVWVSSSMAIRDVETFFPQSSRAIRFLSSRGANGIDGVVSSAAGAAIASGAPTWVLIGDVALLHDVGGLIAAARAGADLRIVCVNNGGGGIFDFLPVAEDAEHEPYERHIATPAGVDLAALAAVAGIEHRLATTADEITVAARTPGLVEVRTDRAENVHRHRQLLADIASEISFHG